MTATGLPPAIPMRMIELPPVGVNRIVLFQLTLERRPVFAIGGPFGSFFFQNSVGQCRFVSRLSQSKQKPFALESAKLVRMD